MSKAKHVDLTTEEAKDESRKVFLAKYEYNNTFHVFDEKKGQVLCKHHDLPDFEEEHYSIDKKFSDKYTRPDARIAVAKLENISVKNDDFNVCGNCVRKMYVNHH